MKLAQRSVCVLLVVGLSSIAWAQAPLPDTGKFSWEFYQAAMAGKTKRAAGEAVPVVSALLVTREPATAENLALLEGLGYTIVGTAGWFVQVRAPVDLFTDPEKGLASLDFILDVDFPPLPDVPTAADERIGQREGEKGEPKARLTGTGVIQADEVWRLGYTGQGAKIAVIEWGYDMANPTLRARVPAPVYYSIQVTKGEPGYVATEGRSASWSTDDQEHGSACAMIAADIAPSAHLYLLSIETGNLAPDSLFIGWLKALEFAVCELKVDVATTQIGWVSVTSGADGVGPLYKGIDRILEVGCAKGRCALVTTAAGNQAGGDTTNDTGSGQARRWSYSASFVQDPTGGRHVFDPEAVTFIDRTSLWFKAGAGDKVTVLLEWDDWGTEARTVDLDLYLYDAKYPLRPAAVRLAKHMGNTVRPVESLRQLEIPYTGTFAVVVENRGRKPDDPPLTGIGFRLYFWNHSNPSEFEHHTKCGSVRELAASRNLQVIAVGAVDQNDLRVRTYSSRGPTFDGRAKPDLYAPDGVLGIPYGNYRRGFTGTSASSPHVAGAIALLRSASPNASPEAILDALRQGATVLGPDSCGNPVLVINALRAVQYLLAQK